MEVFCLLLKQGYRCIQILPFSPSMSLSCSRIPHCIFFAISLNSPSGWDSSLVFPCPWPGHFLMSVGRVFVDCVLIWVHLNLSHIGLGFWMFGRNTTEAKCPEHSVLGDTGEQRDLLLVMLTLTPWLGRCLSAFSTKDNVILFPFHILLFRSESLSPAYNQREKN